MKAVFCSFLCLFLVWISHAQNLYELNKLKINLESSDDFSPVMYQNGIVFCSTRRSELLSSLKTEDNTFHTNIFFSEKGKKDKFQNPEVFGDPFSSRFHDGPMSITSNENLIYFSRNVVVHSAENELDSSKVLGIFSSSRKGDAWTVPVAFEFNNKQFDFTHPAISPDGESLVFVSNMPFGTGGYDLYESRKENGKWGSPVGLDIINSELDEMFPMYHPSGVLFFSSKSFGSVGGLDIFYSEKLNGKWNSPIRLDRPFNSDKDDFGLHSDLHFTTGYFTSNRKGSDDIWQVVSKIPVFENCDTLIPNNYCFTFYEEGNFDIGNLPLVYEWDLGDGKRIRGTEADHCYRQAGNYTVNLNIIDTLTHELFLNEASYEFILEDVEQLYIESDDTAGILTEIVFQAKSDIPEFEFENCFWFFGDGLGIFGENDLGSSQNCSHVYKKSGKYMVTMGAVDKGGNKKCISKPITVEDNFSASFKRNKSTHLNLDEPSSSSVLTEKIHEIYEESVFKVEVKSDSKKMESSDPYFDKLRDDYEIDEHQVEGNGQYSYTVGRETEIDKTYEVYTDVKEKGYKDAKVRAYKMKEVEELLKKWSNIYFEYNSAQITKKSQSKLYKLSDYLMSNTSIKLEISAHTDDIAGHEYNMELSTMRAESIVEFLVKRGVERKRLIPKGFGETQPVTSNDTEEGRKQNRRVEFRIID